MALNDYEKMIALIEEKGIHFDEKEIAGRSGCYGKHKGAEFIFVSPMLSTAEKLVCAAHELGHSRDGGSTASNGQRESRAKRFASNNLVSLPNVIKAILKGCRTIHDLSDCLNLPPEFVEESLKIFRVQYGARIDHGIWELNLDPVFIRNKETGIVIPEE